MTTSITTRSSGKIKKYAPLFHDIRGLSQKPKMSPLIVITHDAYGITHNTF